ncbi:GLPGLI family protein [Porphyromonas levii]|uniref:GLPGLI family protein n=1 Tax=Porphyromonas levii TaxID=28114 RepID=A0A4Y8WR38_9PORP|nr:GLPGLI family protein [Porphyromonas levii]MBR8704150.1 hypothetical protein [Porphyromonas levii]MBR8712433.1 hypothetical protein [Porphyromonas levii]MBR8714395.1 hypothetical protein [Porphyromonas levii]MBR8726936.1 hypothetical protein [Porphyromonas levii]MBR8728901.1 hypothetical protein [Porphyromonas levii]
MEVRKIIFILLLLGYSFGYGMGQVRVVGGVDLSHPTDSAKVNIYDTAAYRVYYTTYHCSDSSNCLLKESYSILLIGNKGYTQFMDYSSFRRDSMVVAAARNGEPESSFLLKAMGLKSGNVLDGILLYNPNSNEFIVQEEPPFSSRFQYVDDRADLEWTLGERDTIVSGIECKMATTHFRGRGYVAWYAPEIPLSYGPYKFGGLPGLILSIYDTKRQCEFTIAGLEPVNYYDRLYTYQEYDHETRENVHKMIRNYYADPASGIKNSGLTITMSDEDWASIKPKPYNPIELE